MTDLSAITEHMDVYGADGVHLGTVDHVEGDRIKLIRADSGQGRHEGHHHFIPAFFFSMIENGAVRLTADADVAVQFEEEADGKPV